MPDAHSVVMGSHIVSSGQSVPVLTIPGADIYIVNFLSAKYECLYTDREHFLTPHGWGKQKKRYTSNAVGYKIKQILFGWY